MRNIRISKMLGIQIVLWITIFFSGEALIYHVRWFVPFLTSQMSYIVPAGHTPLVWFMVQILSDCIFLYVGYLLIRLFGNYRRTGFFDEKSLKVFDGVILACIALAVLGAGQTILNNWNEVHINQWNSLEAISNLLFRSFTNLIVFREPQTMYFLLAIILWAVKQFVTKALFVKSENEAFI